MICCFATHSRQTIKYNIGSSTESNPRFSQYFYFRAIDIVILSGDSNLGPKAFFLLEFEIAPQTTQPPWPVIEQSYYVSSLKVPRLNELKIKVSPNQIIHFYNSKSKLRLVRYSDEFDIQILKRVQSSFWLFGNNCHFLQ